MGHVNHRFPVDFPDFPLSHEELYEQAREVPGGSIAMGVPLYRWMVDAMENPIYKWRMKKRGIILYGIEILVASLRCHKTWLEDPWTTAARKPSNWMVGIRLPCLISGGRLNMYILNSFILNMYILNTYIYIYLIVLPIVDGCNS